MSNEEALALGRAAFAAHQRGDGRRFDQYLARARRENATWLFWDGFDDAKVAFIRHEPTPQ